MNIESKLTLRALKDILADKRVDALSFAELKDFLSESFGQPVKTELPGEMRELRYSLPGRDIGIVESNDGLTFLGSSFRKPKQDQAMPCPNPGLAGTLTGVGTGSAGAFILSFFRIQQRKAAVNLAVSAASTSYWILYNAVAPMICPPPCFPMSTPVVPRLPVVVLTYKTFLGVPYWVTYNATAWQTESITCE